MTCKNCGSKLAENASTCPSCGLGVGDIQKKKNSISFIAMGCTAIALILAIVSYFVPYSYYLQGIGVAFAIAAIVFSAMNGMKNVAFIYGSIVIILVCFGATAYWIVQSMMY